jgi:uncharacterized C2H2 Zn-finger protein
LILFITFFITVYGFRTNYASLSIAQMILYCVGINCNTKADYVFPKNICEHCLEKLKVAHELKTKGIESDRYLQNILLSQTPEIDIDDHLLTPFEPVPPSGLSDIIDEEDEDSLLQPVEEDTEPARSAETSRQYKEYTCEVCNKTFKYRKPYINHLMVHPQRPNKDISKKQAPYDSRSPYETPALYNVPDIKSESPTLVEPIAPRGLRTGEFTCRVCNKSFRYQKAYANHMKLHSSPLTPAINRKLKRKYGLHRRENLRCDESDKEDSLEQEDDENDDNEEEDLEENRRGHESSPDLSGFMAENFLNYEQQPHNNEPSESPSPEASVAQNSDEIEMPVKRSRGRPPNPDRIQKLSRTATLPRGRGRPRKHFNNPIKQKPDEGPPEEVASLLEGFTEVDLSKVLKSKDTFDENSISNSAHSTFRSRSRSSSSVELVQEFDIFGSPKAVPPPARTTFACYQEGCDRKFHLRANLKKHCREDHNLT